MRILIDECVDPRVKALFAEHDAKTVHEMGWDQLLYYLPVQNSALRSMRFVPAG